MVWNKYSIRQYSSGGKYWRELASGAGLFLHGGAQLEVAHEAMKVIRVDTQKLGGFRDVTGGLVEGAEN